MAIKLTLQQIICNATSHGAGDDDVFVTVQPDAGAPIRLPQGPRHTQDMSTDEHGDSVKTWSIGRTFVFERDLLITLYDRDASVGQGNSDYLVSYDYTPGSLPTSVTLSNPNGANYTVKVSIDG